MAVAVWIDDLTKAVKARLEADTGTGGLFATSALVTGVYNRFAPPATDSSTTLPYLVFRVQTIDNRNEAFALGARTVTFTLSIIAPELDGGGDPIQTLYKIHERIYGDWTQQSSGQPSYGLHRWNPSMTMTNWNISMMSWSQTDDATDEGGGVYRLEMTFTVIVSKAYAGE